MLKGIDPLLGPELLMILRTMGHGDEIAIVDGNYPAAADARRLVRMDGHGAEALLAAILSVMPLDGDQQAAFRPGIHGNLAHEVPIMRKFQAIVQNYEPQVILQPLLGDTFYARVKGAFAIVASGERALYGNLVLRKGVVTPEM